MDFLDLIDPIESIMNKKCILTFFSIFSPIGKNIRIPSVTLRKNERVDFLVHQNAKNSKPGKIPVKPLKYNVFRYHS